MGRSLRGLLGLLPMETRKVVLTSLEPPDLDRKNWGTLLFIDFHPRNPSRVLVIGPFLS